MDEDYLIKVNVFLIFICLMGLVIIGGLVYHISDLSDEINTELMGIEEKIPKCPKCELKCPENNCPKCPECPDCTETGPISKTPTKGADDKIIPPKKQEVTKECPTVKEIVAGIFPGRNTEVVDGGRYFKVDASNTYDGLSSSNFYSQTYNFPIEKMLRPDIPLRRYNIGGEEVIDNSIENENVSNANKSTKMISNSDPVPSNTHSDINYLESNTKTEETTTKK